ncbi:peptide chain release factor N(5)-glutamine methyltransferase [Campylobacter sputorum]|uniref:peptide chain release factor N(5)-glutamine methyltransferase n=1 Tax=Campylobacter sputorum TaxID=206 RepID=UPI000B778B78|nr:peptide chain release factor N(5)-glutamine methyltransferase [Campylobacter sputorum]ASM36826.1 protein-(glutamine-N5) methyltransferase [Campylobacter sputorum bv. faecalis CCUG 20703]
MKISELLKIGENLTDSSFVAKELMKFHTKLSFEEIFLNSNTIIKDEDGYIKLIKRYANGEPLEYITNSCEFYGLNFFVKKGVLIPRFETEILIQKAINLLSNINSPRICEIGFGSGIISIILAKNLKNASIIATDISKIALEVAICNAKTHGVNVEFVNTSLLDGISGNFDFVISNPPYISNSYKLDKWVLNEPKEALIGGEIGDEILHKIIEISANRTNFLACEMGYDQKKSLQEKLIKFGFKAEFYKDLAGFDRGFVARRENV